MNLVCSQCRCIYLFSLVNSDCESLNQVYRVSDMELVRVLPSAEDEVNVACFHPLVGGGLVYGTKVVMQTLYEFLIFWLQL